jgi:hypothetical protein
MSNKHFVLDELDLKTRRKAFPIEHRVFAGESKIWFLSS